VPPSQDLGSVGPSLETDPRWELVLRIADSALFGKSSRLREFLLYVCQAALEDRLNDINEQKIGERVFGRSEHYNPAEDNIVRAHARILRQKLDSYFANEGAQEPFLLRIPKGGYVPEFSDRKAQLVARPVEDRRARLRPDNPWMRAGILTLVILSLITNLVLAWSLMRAKTFAPAVVNSDPSPGLKALWSQLFSDKMTTAVVVSDSTYYMIQEATGQQLDLHDYLKGSFPDTDGGRKLRALFPRFEFRRYTTFDGLVTALRVLKLSERFDSRVVLRYPRDVTLRDLSPGNVIFIGRPSSNAWEKLFESKLNFFVDFDEHHGVWRNRDPQPGELPEYVPQRDGNHYNAYGSVAFLPNVSGGNVLIIAGANSASQEGAAQFVTDEALLGRFVQKIGAGKRLPYFDALLRTTTVDEVSQEPSLVAYRILGK